MINSLAAVLFLWHNTGLSNPIRSALLSYPEMDAVPPLVLKSFQHGYLKARHVFLDYDNFFFVNRNSIVFDKKSTE